MGAHLQTLVKVTYLQWAAVVVVLGVTWQPRSLHSAVEEFQKRQDPNQALRV